MGRSRSKEKRNTSVIKEETSGIEKKVSRKEEQKIEIEPKLLPETKNEEEENIKEDIEEKDDHKTKENDQPSKQKKKRIKKKRIKDSMPCNINKRYIMKASHLSKKEYASQCRTREIKCKQTKTCFVHEGRHNLKKIRKWVTNINKKWISEMNHPIWKQGITWDLVTGGFMETLLNFKFI